MSPLQPVSVRARLWRNPTSRFADSKTGIFLKDVGLDKTAVSYYEYYAGKGRDLRAWAEETAPQVTAKAAELRTQAEPYWAKAKAGLWDAYARLVEATRWLVLKVEEQVPGAQEKLQLYWEEAGRLSAWAFERACHFAALAAKLATELALAAWQLAQETYHRIAK